MMTQRTPHMKFSLRFIFIVLATFFVTTLAQANFSQLPNNAEEIIEAFSQKKTLTKKDLPQLNRIIEMLVQLDYVEPTRTTSMQLSASYHRNKQAYRRAIALVEKKCNPDQKLRLSEIHEILRSFHGNGNG